MRLSLVLVALLFLALPLKAQLIGLFEPKYGAGCENGSNRGLGWIGPGTIGVTCKAAVMGDASRAAVVYPEFILDGNSVADSSSEETKSHIKSYSIQILNLIEQIARDFYRERALIEERQVSDEELEAWIRAIFSVAHQEAQFTHYQFQQGDEANEDRLKILVGDLRRRNGNTIFDEQRRPMYGSKGMFQILLSHHSARAENGLFDLVQNIQYGIEYAYQQWVRAIGLHPPPAGYRNCRSQIQTSDGIDYRNGARAMYSMYNGGPQQICRWANSKSVYVKHDQGYVEGYDNQPWQQWATDEERAALKKRVQLGNGQYEDRFDFSFDLNCARQGYDFCMKPKESTGSFQDRIETYARGKLLRVNRPEIIGTEFENNFCVFDENHKELLCTSNEKNIPCLRSIGQFGLHRSNIGNTKGRRQAPPASYYELYAVSFGRVEMRMRFEDDTNVLCGKGSEGVFVSGDFIEVQKNINLREKPSTQSKRLGSATKGNIYQVLGFEIDASSGFSRWYRIAHQSDSGEWFEGYVYGGNDLDWNSWVKGVSPDDKRVESSYRVIPRVGDLIKTSRDLQVHKSLYSDEEASEESNVATLPQGVIFEVKSIHYKGPNSELFLELDIRGSKPSLRDIPAQWFMKGFISSGYILTNQDSVTESITRHIEVVRGEM